MQFRKASERDRQVEAWTKIPEDEARVISALAKDRKESEYRLIRKLLRLGLISMSTYDKKYAKPEVIERIRKEAKVKGSECPWYFDLNQVEPTRG